MKKLVSIAAVAALSQPAFATSINFDNILPSPNGSVINLAYLSDGVTFNNPLGVSPDNQDSPNIFARKWLTNASPENVVSVFGMGFAAFDVRWGAVEAVFTAPQRKVSIDAAIQRFPGELGMPTNSPYMEVYDASNTVLAVVQWNFGLIPQPWPDGITPFETLSFTSGSANIAKIRLASGQPSNTTSNYGLFDNLYFSPAVPEPSTYATFLLGFGLTGLAAWRRKHNG